MANVRQLPSPQLPPGLLLGLTLAVAVTGTFSTIRHFLDQKRYESAINAYQAGDCNTAVKEFNQVIDAVRLADIGNYTEHSLQKKAECTFFQNALSHQNAGQFELALFNYAKVAIYDHSALFQPIKNQVSQIFQQTPVNTLVSRKVCSRINHLAEQNLLPNSDQNLPLLYSECGKVYEQHQTYYSAIKMYEQFLQQYPNHTLAENVRRSLAQTTVADIKSQGARTVESPLPTGRTADGSTVIEIQNSSPNPMRLTFSGVTPKFETVEKCKDCVTYFNPPKACPQKGPITRFVIEPGQYDIAAKPQSSFGNRVNPWSGNWILEPGKKYQTCFFVVRNLMD
jgi:TolA-binding protein